MCGGGRKTVYCPKGKWTLVAYGWFLFSRTYQVNMEPDTTAEAKQYGGGPPWYWSWTFKDKTQFKLYPWDIFKYFYIKPDTDSTAVLTR